MRYKQVPIPTFERAIEYCIRAQTETESFQKKYQGDLLNHLDISLLTISCNSSPSRMTKPQTTRRNSATSESAKEDQPLQGIYPPDETIIANTTPSGKDPDKRSLSFASPAYSSYGGTGKSPKLSYAKSSDEEDATSD